MRISTKDMSRLMDYDAALEHYNSIKPWRGYDDIKRPIGDRSRKHKAILKGRDGEIRCRLYNTDVVIYWPDGSLEVEYWPSTSTNAFVNALLPAHMRADYCKEDPVFWVKSFEPEQSAVCMVGYTFENKTLRWRPVQSDVLPWHWELHPDSEPIGEFTKLVLDRKVAREALAKTKYSDFAVWMRAVQAFEKQSYYAKRYFEIDRDEVIDYLEQGFEGWKEFYNLCIGAGRDPLKEAREAIYKGTFGIVKKETFKTIIHGSYEGAMANTRQLRKYR